MIKNTYESARRDHEYLWGTYGPAADMTGAYVDQSDLKKLLEKPTKACARDCYINQIDYWFQAGPDGTEAGDYKTDPAVRDIAERYGCGEPLNCLIDNHTGGWS